MLRQTVNFTDFNGNQRTRELHFNMDELELIKLQERFPAGTGFQTELEDAIAAKDLKRLRIWIEEVITLSYGVKSEDGLYFRKSPEILADFQSAPYYSDFVLGLFMDEGKAAGFVRGIFPPELIKRAEAKQAEANGNVNTSEERKIAEQNVAPSAREQFAALQNEKEQATPVHNVFEAPQPVVEQAPTDFGPAQGTQDPGYQAWLEQQRRAMEANNQNASGHTPPHQQG